MKLINKDKLIEIIFKENRSNVLVLEDPLLFTKYVCEFNDQYNGLEGNWILSELDKEYQLDKYASLVLDPISLSINNRTVINKLYSDVEKHTLSSEKILSLNAFNQEVNRFIEEIVNEFDYDVSFDSEFDIKSVLKFANVRFNDESDTLLEKLINYVKICSSLMRTKLFIFINLKAFLNDKDLEYLYTQIYYLKSNVLLIESFDKQRLLCEDYAIVDKDYCLIDKNMEKLR